jgi:hypothetical protein
MPERKPPVRKQRCPYCRQLRPFYQYARHVEQCEMLR